MTAKDKLRALLGAGLDFADDRARCFSAERSASSTLVEHGQENASAWLGMAQPEVYSAGLSEFVFAAGVKLLQEWQPDIMYLTTTDYVQHKHAPGTPAANTFYAMMDRYWAELEALGCTLALTADHGMKAKHDGEGRPRIVYLQSLFDEWLTPGTARVILPITDPYVVHHGALGGFATAYLPEGADGAALRARLEAVPGIQGALERDEACRRFELPPDRVGDVMVISTRNKALGTSRERHDLSGLKEPLRSHGGLSEQKVPLIVNRPAPSLAPDRHLRNFDIFDVVLNHAT